MGGLFSSPAPVTTPVLENPAAPAPTPRVDTGSNIALGTDALSALNARAGKTGSETAKATPAKKTTGTAKGTTGLGGLGLI